MPYCLSLYCGRSFFAKAEASFKCFYQRADKHISRFADMLFATKVGGTPAARVRMLNRYQTNGKSRGPEFILK